MSDISASQNPPGVPRDMSRLGAKKRTAASIRKNRERAALRNSNRTKVEVWVSPESKQLLKQLTMISGRSSRSLMEMVLEHVGNKFLGQVLAIWQRSVRAGEIRQQFERFPIALSPLSKGPIRIKKGTEFITLDPAEYFKSLDERTTLDLQLRQWGFDKEIVAAGGIKRRRALRRAVKSHL